MDPSLCEEATVVGAVQALDSRPIQQAEHVGSEERQAERDAPGHVSLREGSGRLEASEGRAEAFEVVGGLGRPPPSR